MIRRIVLTICFIFVAGYAYSSGQITIDGQIAEPHIIQWEGTTERQQPILNLTGTGVANVDSTSLSKTTVTINDAAGNATLDTVFIKQAGEATGAMTSDMNFNNNTLVISYDDNRVGIVTNAPSATLDVRGGATFNSDLADEDFIVYSKFNQFFTIDSGLNRVGIGTDAPLTRLHINGTNPAVFMSDAGNGGYWSFGSRTGNFRITENDASNVIVNQYLEIGVSGGDVDWNYNNEDLDVVFNGDTAEIARFNAGTDTLDFPDDKAIKLGSGGDALIDYDSGGNSLDIDLKTNGINTDLKIVTDGNDNTLFIDGQNGNIGIGTSAPTSILHIKAQTNPKVLLEDVDNAQDWSFGSSGSNFHFIDQTAGSISRIKIVPAGEAIVNESGSDYDFRVEGVGQANALFVQGSDGFVGIGTNAPSQTLTVSGTGLFTSTNQIYLGDTGTYINQATDGHLDLTADVSIDLNGVVEITGDTYWLGDGSGTPYGHMYTNTNIAVTIASSSTPTEVFDATSDGWTTGKLNLVTFPTGGDEHYISVDKAGFYKIDWSMSCSQNTPAAAIDLEGGIMIGGVAQNEGIQERNIANSTDIGSFASTAILDLAANAQISLYLNNKTNTTNIDVEHANLSVTMVGGT